MKIKYLPFILRKKARCLSSFIFPKLPYKNKGYITLYEKRIIQQIKAEKTIIFSLLAITVSSLALFLIPIINAKTQNNSKKTKRLSYVAPKKTLAQKLAEENIYQIADKNFSLIIPKININHKVLVNIDLAKKLETEKSLEEALVHAKNSALPNEAGTVYILGHSTNSLENIEKYNAIFFHLNKLEKNDKIFVVYNQRLFSYQVSKKQIINPNQLEEIDLRQSEKRLVLQTCWPPGTTWQRLLITGKQVPPKN